MICGEFKGSKKDFKKGKKIQRNYRGLQKGGIKAQSGIGKDCSGGRTI